VGGELAELRRRAAPLTAAVLRGLLETVTTERVNLVNAALAKARGITVVERKSPDAEALQLAADPDRREPTASRRPIGGTVANGEPALHPARRATGLDMAPSPVMLVTSHHDRPGTVGRIGLILGKADVNISAMHLARSLPRVRRPDDPGARRRGAGRCGRLDPDERRRPRTLVDPPRSRSLTQAGGPSEPTAASAAHPASAPQPTGRLVIPVGLEATVVLLRHGESVFITEGRFQGRADSPLSPLGERQAALAAARLAAPMRAPALPIADRAPLEIVHSPLMRAATTARLSAEAIGAARGVPPPLRAEPDLAELGQGSWEGRQRTDIEANDGDILAAWRREPLNANAPGGERVLDAAERVLDALGLVVANLAAASGPSVPGTRTVVAGYPGATAPDAPWTLLVGHDGIFKVVLLTLLDLPLERFWTFPFALCGLSVVELRDGRGILRVHNLTEHLASLAATTPSAAPAPDRPAGAL
jgi:broad specificity phosphatase PhoE